MNSSPFNTKARKPVSMADVAGEMDDIQDKPSENFSAQRLVGMTFNMPVSWHTRFKITAAEKGITMRQLLEDCFSAYIREEKRKQQGK